jgi:hypothetical protein
MRLRVLGAQASNLSQLDEGTSLTAMSRHRIAGFSAGGGRPSFFGRSGFGARFAALFAHAPRWGAYASVYTGLFALLTTSGCLVTDQIELPPVPQSPPIVSLTDYDDDGIIVFNRDANNEMLMELQVRNEDVTEPLKMRWRIASGELPPGAPSRYYTCPEPEVMRTGVLTRTAQLNIVATNFNRGKCSRVDVIVSGSFKTCRPDRDDDGWDITTQDDDDADIGRLSFWVWATDSVNDPFLRQDVAQQLAASCLTVDYRAPVPTGTASPANSLAVP